MSNVPSELKYTEDHEWTKIESGVATFGITDFAQNALGDIVFVELPEVGDQLKKGDSFGVVESIKSVSDLYLPLSGEVTEVNQELVDDPAKCNSGPYDAWMIKIKVSDPSEEGELMSPEDYQAHCDSQ
jgi:glycine cleavage system H protein